jgi:hypothetical protein
MMSRGATVGSELSVMFSATQAYHPGMRRYRDAEGPW